MQPTVKRAGPRGGRIIGMGPCAGKRRQWPFGRGKKPDKSLFSAALRAFKKRASKTPHDEAERRALTDDLFDCRQLENERIAC